MTNHNVKYTALIERVQHNCHISDAHHARDYSLCIYLLKMREFYRWEQGFAFGQPLARGPLGEWLTAREHHWEQIQEEDFQPVELSGTRYLPFDSNAINTQLVGEGMVYSGGYHGAKPHFFLAELEHVERSEGASIYISGCELARELTAPPAMSLGDSIFLRRESLRRMIWEMLEEWGWQDPHRAIAHAAAFYNFNDDLQAALDAITADELDTLLQHELGELAIGRELGPEWEAMLAALPRSRAEFQLRAIRDHLVDCSRTLPWLMDEARDAALHFYFANFTATRKELFPALEAAYQKWLRGDDGKALRETVKRGVELWRMQAESALSVYREVGDDGAELMQRLNQLEID
ncbi:MAG: Sfum_1244 family protein [Pseudomonadota bacterium]